MFSAPTAYHRGSHAIEVLPGESHSAAWAYLMRGGPLPEERYPCAHDPAAARVRRHSHDTSRRREHRRAVLTHVA